MEDRDIISFIEARLPLEALAFVPEIRLHQARPASGIRRLAERDPDFSAPYWAYRWAGGLALARFLLDHPIRVAGLDVLDLGCGGGVAAIAAALAGARTVTAIDTDRYALVAAGLNARANGVALTLRQARNDDEIGDAEIVLAGDVFYDLDVAARSGAVLAAAVSRGAEVLVGDPWRAPLPVERLTVLADYAISERDGLEPTRASVFAFAGQAGAIAPLPVPVPA